MLLFSPAAFKPQSSPRNLISKRVDFDGAGARARRIRTV